MKARFITIGISHFCEKVRWVMDHFDFPYFEEAHAPIYHYLATFPAGAGRTVPVLIDGNTTLTDSTDILQFLSKKHPAAAKLYEGTEHCDPLELEEYFDLHLGNASRVISYYYNLKDPSAAIGSAIKNTPLFEALTLPFAMPLASPFLKWFYEITETNLKKSIKQVDNTFRRVENILSKGGPYLSGKEPGAADFTFSALAAPILLPEYYIPEISNLENLDSEFSSLVKKWRETVAGQFADKMYQSRH
jgi:glutathione S-transferase